MQSSTVGPNVEELTALGARRVDAPVIGTRRPWEEGTLTVLLSGPEDARDAVRPVVDAVAARVLDVGDRVGEATRLTLLLNTWVLLLTASTAEVLALAEAAGVDAGLVLSTLKGGPM